MKNVKYQYETEFAAAAFIDVLGTSEAIKEDADRSLNEIHLAYDDAVKELKMRCPAWVKEFKVNIFSDNILLSCKAVKGEEIKAFYAIIYFSALLQISMWTHNLLVRGGISWGSFFSDETMVWGKALLKAYNLESKAAVYPRIVVEPEIADIIMECRSKSQEGLLLSGDFDGMYYVDPFGIEGGQAKLVLLEQFLDDNKVRLEKSKGNPRVHQKHSWLQRYFCEKYREINGKDFR